MPALHRSCSHQTHVRQVHALTFVGYEGSRLLSLVIEYDDGRVVAFEVKASERAPGKDFRGLAQLRDLLGERFIGGIMLTTGSQSYTYEDREFRFSV